MVWYPVYLTALRGVREAQLRLVLVLPVRLILNVTSFKTYPRHIKFWGHENLNSLKHKKIINIYLN